MFSESHLSTQKLVLSITISSLGEAALAERFYPEAATLPTTSYRKGMSRPQTKKKDLNLS